MRNAILNLVLERRNVSFVEVQALAGAGGEYAICHGRFPNLVFGNGLSKEAVDAIAALRLERLVEFDPSSVLVYLVDGCIPSLPLAKAKSEAGVRRYTKPHWLPVMLNPGPNAAHAA